MNNQAVVVQINKTEEIPGMDRIQLVKLFGTQVITGKDVKVGDIMIYIDSNMKMSDNFLHANNLYRHSELNADKTKSGYFGDDGRVKCIKMRGETSDGFLFQFEYLSYLGVIKSDYDIGEEFDSINGDKFCEKYIPLIHHSDNHNNGKKNSGRKAFKAPMFVEHWDTSQFMRNKHRIPAQTICYIEEKVHGTSHRTGHVEVNTWNEYPWWKKLLYRLAHNLENGNNYVTQWQYLNGTRRVVHTPDTQKSPYHDNTMREEVLENLKAQKLFKGEQLYMELFGYEKTGKQIQKGFPYGCESHIRKDKGEGGLELQLEYDNQPYRNLLYRITMNNEDGKVVDHSREYVYNRAEELGLEKPHLFEKVYFSGTKRSMEILEEKIVNYAQGQSELANDTLKEGVVVWFINEQGNWECLKYKSDAFRLKESGDKDKGVIDQEDLN